MTERSREVSGQAGPSGRKPDRLTRRADYVAAAKGRRFHSASLSLQAIERPAAGAGSDAALLPRFGLTVSRKVGNAVVRNRVKRRLREALRRIEAGAAVAEPARPAPGWDYVIVARTAALTQPFPALVAEITTDIAGVHTKRPQPARGGRGGGGRPSRTGPQDRAAPETSSFPETR